MTERHIISGADLPDMRRVGGRYRASCPIHGSDHQRSLSIQPEGEYAGFGKCFACGAEVLIRDMNPEAAQRLAALGARPITAERLLRPVTRYQAEAAPWQQAELLALQALEPRMRAALLASDRARAYLAARCISYDLASALGVGYLPASAANLPEVAPVQKWIDRLIFPLSSADGRGYAGRALSGWRSGMDENEHKRVLDAPGAPERWRKTYPAGWQGLAELSPDLEQLIIVEGPFDRLALIAAGIAPDAILALVGSRDSRAAEWIPAHVKRVIIALDGDQSGKKAAEALHQALYRAGLAGVICTPPDDGMGKDWSERLRLGGLAALSPVLEAASAPIEQAAPSALLPWRVSWDGLELRKRLYQMAEALRFPALQIGSQQIDAGDRVGWYHLAEGAIDLAALAYETLLPHFQR